MGRHSKPTSALSASGKLAAVATAGALAAIPITQGTAQAADGGGGGQSWDDVKGAIAHCESGQNPRARNAHSTASGEWQLLKGTWASVGGLLLAPTAAQASQEQQDTIAGRLFAREGLNPWKASQPCWSRLLRSGARFLPSRRVPQHAAPRRATPQPAPAAGRGGYTVRAGDSLSEIAEAHGVTWQQLWAANRAAISNPSLIHIGLNITLP